jgi:predicted  nucleic acid-binding Zn-ribbon protein
MMKGVDQNDEFMKLLPTLKSMVRNDQELDDAMSELRNKHHAAYTAIERLQHTFTSTTIRSSLPIRIGLVG